MSARPRTGVVTTLINADKVVNSFIKYHHRIGFDHIYLFFDDPYDRTIGRLNGVKGVTVVVNDRHLQQAWKNTRLYKVKTEYHPYIQVEAMSRQMLNMAIACEMAVNDRIDWLLHIDIDELFYLPDQTVQDHFTMLTRNNIPCCHYSNYEGVPEKFDIDDFFKEVTLFKRNPEHYSFRLQSRYKNHYKDDFFNYYKIGKMAAQVDKIDIPLLHEVIVKEEKKRLVSYWYERKVKVGTLIKRLYTSGSVQFPVILHYPICGFVHFIDKYRTLGNFEDKWFGERDILPFHKKSRDIVRGGNIEATKDFFRKHVMMDEGRIRELQKEGFLIRVDEPLKLING
jgi:hypothetical protein